MFILKKLLSALLLPPLLPWLLVALGLLMFGRRPRLGRFLAALGLTLALLLTMPWFVGRMLAPLENIPVLTPDAARGAQAIVILGGGKHDYAPEYGGETVSRLTLERVRYGALLARKAGLPVLVTGGAPYGGQSEAALMKGVLEQDFGVPVRWAESRSRDTRENARFSASLLAGANIHRVILVSHAAHLKRALAEFRDAGLEAVPAPTSFLGGSDGTPEAQDFLPESGAAYAGWYASHEWLGLMARKLGL